MPPFQNNLFNPVNMPSPGQVNPTVGRGSLVVFNYVYHKPGHDASPLVMVTDVWQDFIRGVNLHYLTFPEIKKLIFSTPGKSVCESGNFTYQYIKQIGYINSASKKYGIVSAFRQYKRGGIQQLKKLNCEFVANALALSRSFDPNEIEAIRQSVREQIRRITNPAAEAPVGQNPVTQPINNALL